MSTANELVSICDDGETGEIERLTFRSRTLHLQLASVEEAQRPKVVRDALEIGAEVLVRAGQRGDLEKLGHAVERLDEESRRIVAATGEQVEKTVGRAISEMTATINGDAGPFNAMLQRFDPAADGNVIEVFRDLVAATATKVTRQAVKELAEATQDTIDRLVKSMAILDKVATAEEARFDEARRGHAKGVEHEHDTETLLGELVGVTGDSLDDVSTIAGVLGTRKGDHTITARKGCIIVIEEKCTKRLTETVARKLLDESMANRGAHLGMLIVDDESKVPGNQPFHFIDDDKVVVVADRPALRVVYALFRAKSIELLKTAYSNDDEAVTQALDRIRHLIDEIKRATERFRLLRTEHTKAATAISQARIYVDEAAEAIADSIAAMTALIDDLADVGAPAAA